MSKTKFIIIQALMLHLWLPLKAQDLSPAQTQQYQNAPNYPTKVEIALSIAKGSFNSEDAFAWLAKAENDANSSGQLNLIAKVYAEKGQLYFRIKNNIDSARYFYDLAISQLPEGNYDSLLVKINDLYITLHYNANQHAEAIEKNLFNLGYYERIDDQKMAAYTYNRIANSNNYLGYHDIAMKYYEASLSLYTSLNDHYGIGKVYGNMAIIYGEEGNYDQAIKLYHLSINNYKLGGTEVDVAHSYVNLGNDLITVAQLDSSEYYLTKAYNIFKIHPEEELELAFCQQSIGKLYEAKKEYQNAIYNYKSALAIAYKISNAQLTINNHEFLADIYEKTGDYREAYINFKKSHELADSLSFLTNVSRIAEMQAKYENAKQQAENEQLKMKSALDQTTINQQKIYTTSFAIIVFILLASSIVLFTAYRKILHQKQISDRDKKLIIKQSDRIKKNDKLKSQFFSNISHELRTPLTILMGLLDQFILRSEDKLDEHDKQKLTLIKENSQKIKSLIDEVFELTKMDAHKVILNAQPEEILPLMERLVFTFHSLAHEKNQELNISYGQIHHVYLNIDTNKFEKIINNLIMNAIKFTQEGGTINVTLALKDGGETLEIKISDNGPGISEEDKTHIFDRYFQSQHDQDQANPGTGLGLSMVKELTKLHGGKVSVTSELTKGTAFILTFPVIKQMPKTAQGDQTEFLSNFIENPHEKSTENGSALVMIVEDNPDMRSFLNDTFSPDYRTIACQNGDEALLALKSTVPDLIVTDLMMPKMDGNTLLKNLKSDSQYSTIPVIILTAKLAEVDKLDALRLGVDDYITKPFNINEIKIKAGNLIKQAQSRREWLAKETPFGQLEHNDDQFIQQFAKFVKDNIQNTNIHIATLADHLAMSERQLFRKVGAMTGLTPNQLIREIKLRHAHDLLKKKTFTKVSALAREIGFESGPYFSKLYFEKYGKKPSEEL